jgi:hypothetical protein
VTKKAIIEQAVAKEDEKAAGEAAVEPEIVKMKTKDLLTSRAEVEQKCHPLPEFTFRFGGFTKPWYQLGVRRLTITTFDDFGHPNGHVTEDLRAWVLRLIREFLGLWQKEYYSPIDEEGNWKPYTQDDAGTFSVMLVNIATWFAVLSILFAVSGGADLLTIFVNYIFGAFTRVIFSTLAWFSISLICIFFVAIRQRYKNRDFMMTWHDAVFRHTAERQVDKVLGDEEKLDDTRKRSSDRDVASDTVATFYTIEREIHSFEDATPFLINFIATCLLPVYFLLASSPPWNIKRVDDKVVVCVELLNHLLTELQSCSSPDYLACVDFCMSRLSTFPQLYMRRAMAAKQAIRHTVILAVQYHLRRPLCQGEGQSAHLYY